MLTVDIWQLFYQCMWKQAMILTSGSNAVSYAVVNFCRGSYIIKPPVYSGGKDWLLIENLRVLSDMFWSSLNMLSYYSFWQNFTLMCCRALCLHIVFSWYLPEECCVAVWCSYSSLQTEPVWFLTQRLISTTILLSRIHCFVSYANIVTLLMMFIFLT